MTPNSSNNIYLAFPPQLQHLINYLKKPKHKGSLALCYELATGYIQIDGLYPTKAEAFNAVLSEGLLLKLLQEQIHG